MSVMAEVEVPRVADERGPSPFSLLFAPDRGMARQAAIGRARWYFVFAWVCSILLATAFAMRVDAKSATLQKLDQGGQLQGMSDRQVAEETQGAERVSQVGSLAKGIARTPFQLGITCLGVLLLVWFLRGRVKGSGVVPIAGATLLPGALADLLDAVVAFRHQVLPPGGAPLAPRTLAELLPLVGRALEGPAAKLAGAVDFYSLWAAVMLAYGVSAVGQISKRNALIGTLVGWVFYRLLTHVAPPG